MKWRRAKHLAVTSTLLFPNFECVHLPAWNSNENIFGSGKFAGLYKFCEDVLSTVSEGVESFSEKLPGARSPVSFLPFILTLDAFLFH